MIRIPCKWLLPIAMAGLTLLCQAAIAEISVVGVDGRDAAANAANEKTFNDMVKRCKQQSPSFKAAFEQMESDKKRTIKIKVGRGGSYLDSADGPGEVSVNLDSLEQLKDPAKDPDGSYKMPRTPDGKNAAWWMTKCEDIVHFTWKAYKTWEVRENYHLVGGTWISNQTGNEFSLDNNEGAHDSGVNEQNKVRKDFGQGDEDRDRASKTYHPGKDPEKTFGYTGTDGKHHKIDHVYIVIYYGHDRKQIFTFVGGQMVIIYIVGSHEVADDKMAKPVPATTEKTDDTQKADDKTGGGTGGGTTGGDKSTEGGGGGGALKSLLPVIPLLGGGHGDHRGEHRRERVHHNDKTTTKRTGSDGDKVTPPRTTDAPKTDTPTTDR